MKFLNKKTNIKLMAQLLIFTSIFGVGTAFSSNVKANASDITNIESETDYTTQLSRATQAVEKAEITKDRIDVSIAQNLVNKLAIRNDRYNLSIRLNKVSKNIESQILIAKQAVMKAENSALQSDIDIAKVLVDSLTDSTTKALFQARLNKINSTTPENYAKQLTIATQAVERAEATKDKIDVSDAQHLVDEVSNRTDRNNLSNRLNEVSKDIESQILIAKQAVMKAESSLLQSDVDTAKVLVDDLTDSTTKALFQTRLNKIIVNG